MENLIFCIVEFGENLGTKQGHCMETSNHRLKKRKRKEESMQRVQAKPIDAFSEPYVGASVSGTPIRGGSTRRNAVVLRAATLDREPAGHATRHGDEIQIQRQKPRSRFVRALPDDYPRAKRRRPGANFYATPRRSVLSRVVVLYMI
jgi:hypothetical protein